MNKRTTMTYAVAAATAAMLTLAGCNGGDEDPTATPTPTGSSTSSASTSGSAGTTTSPSPSVSISLPSAARANTEAGAIAFGKYFITELDRAYVSTDSAPIEAMSAPSCGGCKAVVAAIKGLHGDRVHQARPAVTIAGGKFVPIQNTKAVDVFASYRSVPRIDSRGVEVTPGKAEKVAYRLTVAWQSQGWKVIETDVLN